MKPPTSETDLKEFGSNYQEAKHFSDRILVDPDLPRLDTWLLKTGIWLVEGNFLYGQVAKLFGCFPCWNVICPTRQSLELGELKVKGDKGDSLENEDNSYIRACLNPETVGQYSSLIW